MNKSNQEILRDIEQKMIENLEVSKEIINKMKSFNEEYGAAE